MNEMSVYFSKAKTITFLNEKTKKKPCGTNLHQTKWITLQVTLQRGPLNLLNNKTPTDLGAATQRGILKAPPLLILGPTFIGNKN